VASGTGHRWQGYSHQELYDQLHSGPGSSAAGVTANRWSGLSGALADIQADISTGVARSGATWEGAAGDSARAALGPLGDWARQASDAADIMRMSTEDQADLLAKARADMPKPVPVTAESPGGLQTALAHLFGGQTDYEAQEAASNAAAQRAYQVMADYEANSDANTTTLGEFGEPPQVVVDPTATAVPAPSGPKHALRTPRVPFTETPAGRRVARFADATSAETTSSTTPTDDAVRPGPTENATTGASSPVDSDPATEPSPGPADRAAPAAPPRELGPPAPTTASTAADTEAGAPAPAPVPEPRSTTPNAAPATPANGTGTTPSAAGAAAPATHATPEGGTTPSAAGAGPATPSAAETVASAAGAESDISTTLSSSAPAAPAEEGRSDISAGLAGEPVRRRSALADAEWQARYLVEADDLYGSGPVVSPPVIGEFRGR
jgi:hypothetical protein